MVGQQCVTSRFELSIYKFHSSKLNIFFAFTPILLDTTITVIFYHNFSNIHHRKDFILMQNLFNELKSFDGRFSRSQYWGYSIGISVFSNVSIRLLDLIQNPILGIVLILAIVIPSAYFSILHSN